MILIHKSLKSYLNEPGQQVDTENSTWESISSIRHAKITLLLAFKVYLRNGVHFSEVYRSVNYIGSVAK